MANYYTPLTPDSYPPPMRSRLPIRVSPVFILLLLVTLLAGSASYTLELNRTLTKLSLFIFVTGGWVVSLCLHEFGHALAAFVGGDHGVATKGYLTLNPFRYTHGVLSILMPLIFLAMGGIGLPGGAVYINPGAIRGRGMRSLSSAAGPLVTAACALVLLTPFASGLVDGRQTQHLAFWAGLALLAFLQLTALFFNLLPIPGLDGFGILAPFLPAEVLRAAYSLGFFTYIIIFLLFFNPTPVSRGFWTAVFHIGSLVNLDFYLVDLGLSLFRFWAS